MISRDRIEQIHSAAQISGRSPIEIMLRSLLADSVAALDEREELLADTLRIASFVRCDMDCLESGDIHDDDCMISQYNAVEDKARDLLRGGRFEVK